MAKRRKGNSAPQVITPKTSSQPEAISTSNVWLPRFLGISIATGLSVMRYWFYGGVFIVYVAIVLAILEICFEPWLLKRSIALQVGLIALVLVLFDMFSIFVVAKQAPLNLQSYAMKNGDYSPGTNIAGIVWDSHLTEMHVTVNNPTDNDYENLDIDMQPDVWTYKAGILTNDSGCQLFPMALKKIIKVNLKSKGGATRITTSHPGEEALDVHDNVGDLFDTLITEAGYRLRCSKLPAHFTVQVVFALATEHPDLAVPMPQPPKNVKPGDYGFVFGEFAGHETANSIFDVMGARPIPSGVQISGKFVTNMKPFKINRAVAVQEGN